MSERPYSSRLYSRRVKLRLLSVQIRVLSGAVRYMCCTSKEEKTPATTRFDPPSAAVIRRQHLYPPRGCCAVHERLGHPVAAPVRLPVPAPLRHPSVPC